MKKNNKEINIIVKNAEASFFQANTIASQLVKNKDIEIFFTIGSAPTQAISHFEKERPIVFAGISNPEELGLIEGKNITGIWQGERRGRRKRVCSGEKRARNSGPSANPQEIGPGRNPAATEREKGLDRARSQFLPGDFSRPAKKGTTQAF